MSHTLPFLVLYMFTVDEMLPEVVVMVPDSISLDAVILVIPLNELLLIKRGL